MNTVATQGTGYNMHQVYKLGILQCPGRVKNYRHYHYVVDHKNTHTKCSNVHNTRNRGHDKKLK